MPPSVSYTCNDNSTVNLYSNAGTEDFYAMAYHLMSEGYEQYYFSKTENNLFSAYKKGNLSVYSYFMAVSGELRTVEQTYSPIPEYISDEKVCQTMLLNVGFDFSDNISSDLPLAKTACGMSNIIVLEDGSYIIIDGGAKNTNTETVTQRLYDILYENNKRSDGRIVIAAWIFTHLHNDHSSTFERFSKAYGHNIELKYILYNYPWISQMETYTSGELNASTPHAVFGYICEKYYSCTPKLYIPHTGEQIKLGCWTMEVLTVYENILPENLTNGNNASMVFRMNPSSDCGFAYSVLFLGDIETQTSDQLVSYYGGYLSTKIVQVAHHGYFDGGSEALYNVIAAEYVLWTNSYARWYEVKSSESGRIVPDWLKNACETELKVYPQCNQSQKATDWYISFENGVLISEEYNG